MRKRRYMQFSTPKTTAHTAMTDKKTDFAPVKEQKSPSATHKIELDHLHFMSVTGVADVPTFTDKTITIKLKDETLQVSGQNLSVKNLDVESGKLQIQGRVDAIKYVTKTTPSSIAKRIFK